VSVSLPSLPFVHIARALALIFAGPALLAACQGLARNDGPVGAFTFDDWAGVPIRVHYVEPAGVSEDAPAIIVMHGTRRNADEYRDNWIELAREHGFRVYAPEFDAERFPGAAGYNLGGAGEAGVRAFDAIEPLYEYLSDERGLPDNGYVIFGHSAGGQFVHRFACFAETPNLQLAIAANAGWYTLPEGPYGWPYSLAGAPEPVCELADYFDTPMVIALGDRDIDPNDSLLRRTPEALAQGPHRLARGLSFLATAGAIADARGLDLNWEVEIVEGVGHDHGAMAQAAAEWLVPWAASTGDRSGVQP